MLKTRTNNETKIMTLANANRTRHITYASIYFKRMAFTNGPGVTPIIRRSLSRAFEYR